MLFFKEIGYTSRVSGRGRKLSLILLLPFLFQQIIQVPLLAARHHQTLKSFKEGGGQATGLRMNLPLLRRIFSMLNLQCHLLNQTGNDTKTLKVHQMTEETIYLLRPHSLISLFSCTYILIGEPF